MNAKIISLLLITTVIMSIAPAALAEETNIPSTNPIEEEIHAEIQAMNTNLGAEIRLLQLAKNIEIKIEIGNTIVEKAQENEEDTAEMDAILAELEMIRQEVLAADPTAEDAVQQFVDLKKDAIELVKEFRIIARELLPVEEQTQLREQAGNLQQERIQSATQIKAKIREHNREKIQELEGNLGTEVSEIAQKIGTGELTTEEATQQIRQLVENMVQEKKQNAFKNRKENSLRRAMQAREQIDEISENHTLRYQERLQNRINNMNILGEQYGELIQERIQERISNSDNSTGNRQGGNTQ